MQDERILLAHGGGGGLTADLLIHTFLPAFSNDVLRRLGDAAVIDPAEHVMTPGSRLAFTTDSYVVKPIFWPGGDLGRLAVCGTVNDLAMVGARPICISVGFIIEEGLPLDDLRTIVGSMKASAEEAGVTIVAGDTKVVERGAADQLFINTSGLGIVSETVDLGPGKVKLGDAILVSGFLGDHGLAVLSHREGVQLEVPLASDVAPLNDLVGAILPYGGVRVLRDPTRGGLAATLNELASQGSFGIMVDECLLPIRPAVHAACELLGYDPLHIANEGKFVAIVDPACADRILEILHAHPYGVHAALIGHVVAEPVCKVFLRTAVGGTRIIRLPAGELLPRIC